MSDINQIKNAQIEEQKLVEPEQVEEQNKEAVKGEFVEVKEEQKEGFIDNIIKPGEIADEIQQEDKKRLSEQKNENANVILNENANAKDYIPPFSWDEIRTMDIDANITYTKVTDTLYTKLEQQRFSPSFNDKYTPEQREKQRMKAGSELFIKNRNANMLIDYDNNKKEACDRKIRGLSDKELLVEPEEVEAAAVFADSSEELSLLLQKLHSDSAEVQKEGFSLIMKKMLEMDLHVDFSNDEAFLAHAEGFSDMASMSRAVEYLNFRYSDVLDQVPGDVKEKYNTRCINIRKLGIYYELKKGVITDDYYRDHTDDELTIAARVDTTKVQRRMIYKMLAADKYLEAAEFIKTKDFIDIVYESKAIEDEERFAPEAKKLMKGTKGEYSKTNLPVDGTVHEKYFNDLLTNPVNAKKLARLSKGNYARCGEKNGNTEFLFRSIGIMAHLKEIQEMDLSDVKALVDDLTALPENNTLEAKEEAFRRNTEGIKKLKDIAFRHMRYLTDKYKNNSYYVTPEESEQYEEERRLDWVWMCDVTEGLIPYLDRIGLIDHKDANDVELMRMRGNISKTYISVAKTSNDSEIHIEDGTTVTMEAVFAAMSCTEMISAFNKYGMKNEKFMFACVDSFLDNGDDLSIHRDAKLRPLKKKQEKITVDRMLALSERKKARAEDKASINKLMKNRWSFFGISPSDSKEMTAVKDGYRELQKVLSDIPSAEEKESQDQKDRIKRAYDVLIKSCETYLSKKNPSTSDGKERLNRVRMIHETILREKNELSEIMEHVSFAEYKSFDEMLDRNLPGDHVSDVAEEKHAISVDAVTDSQRMWELLGNINVPKGTFAGKRGEAPRMIGEDFLKNQLSDADRIKAQNEPDSEIYKKHERYYKLKNRIDEYSDMVTDRLEAAVNKTENLPELKEEELAALSYLMDSDAEKNATLLSLYGKEDKTGALQLSLWQYMNTTIPDGSFDADDDFIASADKLRLVSERAAAMKKLMELHPGFFDNLPDNIKKSFKEKRDEMELVGKFYNLRMSIITDPYYRTHLDEELSTESYDNYSEEQKRLCKLLSDEEKYYGVLDDGGTIPDEDQKIIEGKNTISATRYISRSRTDIRRSRQSDAAEKLMADKWSFFGISPGDSPEMKLIKDGYKEITSKLQAKLPLTAEEKNARWKEARESYDRVIKHCDDYIASRNPYTKSGKMRKQMVETIKDQLTKDRDLLRAGYENIGDKSEIKSLMDLFRSNQPAVIKLDKLPDNVGSGTSVVYKLKEGSNVSFFKPAEKKVDRKNSLEIMQNVVEAANDLEKELLSQTIETVKYMQSFKVAGTLSQTEGMFESFTQGMIGVYIHRDYENMDGNAIVARIKKQTKIPREGLPKDYPMKKVKKKTVPENPADIYFRMAKNPDGSYDTAKVKAVINLYRQGFQAFNTGQQMVNVLGLKGDEDMAIRNVASSRVADLFGLGDIVARSESACISMPDGTLVYGNKMEEAKGISYADLEHKAQKEKGSNIVFSKKAADQRYALYLLDSLCDQVDRNNNNFICDVEETKVKDKEGKEVTRYVIRSIKGIDNDLAFSNSTNDVMLGSSLKRKFGDVNGRKLPLAQTQRFLETDINTLLSSVKDVLEPEALNALALRFDLLKNTISEVMTEKPGLFSDEPDVNLFLSKQDLVFG